MYDGQTSFTTAGWIKFNSVSGSIGIWGKGNSGNASYTQQEWMLYIEGNYIYWVLSDGTHATVLNSNTYTATGQWYFIVAGYDAVSGKAFIQINNGTEQSTTSLGPTDRGNGFTIGRTFDHFLSGLVQSVGVWDRVLTASERTALYNGGSGFDLQIHAKYTYMGLNTVVKVDYPQPQVGLDLAMGSGADLYTGLDRFGRVIDHRWQTITPPPADGTPTDVARQKYGYDPASNRLWREDPVAKAQTLPRFFDEMYAYDAVYRLTGMSRGQLAGGPPPTSITNQNFGQGWTLDPTGNWKGFTEAATGGSNTLAQTRTANSANEITGITNAMPVPAWAQPAYDPVGNMTTVPQPADMTKAFDATYDAWNRLVALRDKVSGNLVQENQYDGLTRRISQKTYDSSGTLAEKRRYYYSDAWQVLEERIGNSNTADRQFVWGLRYIDDLILRDRSVSGGTLNERLFALQDANWNVVALVNTSGAVQQRFAYSPYGVPMFLNADFTVGSNAKDWETLFCGYRWDVWTGVFQVRWRFLHSSLGSWFNRDPIGYQAGVNLYRYCRNAAVGFTDPFGLDDQHHWFPQGQRFKDKLKNICGTVFAILGITVDEFVHRFVTPLDGGMERGSLHHFIHHLLKEGKYLDRIDEIYDQQLDCCKTITEVFKLAVDAWRQTVEKFALPPGIQGPELHPSLQPYRDKKAWDITFKLIEEVLRKICNPPNCPRPNPDNVFLFLPAPAPDPVAEAFHLPRRDRPHFSPSPGRPMQYPRPRVQLDTGPAWWITAGLVVVATGLIVATVAGDVLTDGALLPENPELFEAAMLMYAKAFASQ